MEQAVFLGIDIQTVWYIIIGTMFTIYWIVDGLSSGSGVMHMFIGDPETRKLAANVSGPFRFANEIWLLLGTASLMAVFPNLYAAALSGFYIPVTLWCVCLVIRKTAPEFRGGISRGWWNRLWDLLYSLSCMSGIVIAGLIIAKMLTGVPLDHNHNIEPEFLSLVTPFTLAAAGFILFTTVLHGALFFTLKTQGRLYEISVKMVKYSIRIYIVVFASVHIYIYNRFENMADLVWARPWIAVITAVSGLNLVLIYRKTRKRNYLWAYWLSALNICLLASSAACCMYPNLAASTLHPDYTITIYNASSSSSAVRLLSIASAVLPLVFLYSIITHWTFRGKTRLDENSY